jgi:hypothetical protein
MIKTRLCLTKEPDLEFGIEARESLAVEGARSDKEGTMLPFQTIEWRTTKFAVELTAYGVSLPEDSYSPWCPSCREHLDLHQPDETCPGQLLAVCVSCGRWYVWLEEGEEGSGSVLVAIPAMVDLRAGVVRSGMKLG